MHIGKRLLLTLVFLALPSLSAGQGEEFRRTMEEERISAAMSRKHLTPITSFAYIIARSYHTGRDKQEGQGFNAWDIDEEMSSFLRLRFQNDFRKFSYEPQPMLDRGPKIGALQCKICKDPKLGTLQCKIWLHGDSYPIAYHVDCILGPGARPRALHDATLGIATEDRATKDIQEALDRMVSKFARIFFKARENP